MSTSPASSLRLNTYAMIDGITQPLSISHPPKTLLHEHSLTPRIQDYLAMNFSRIPKASFTATIFHELPATPSDESSDRISQIPITEKKDIPEGILPPGSEKAAFHAARKAEDIWTDRVAILLPSSLGIVSNYLVLDFYTSETDYPSIQDNAPTSLKSGGFEVARAVSKMAFLSVKDPLKKIKEAMMHPEQVMSYPCLKNHPEYTPEVIVSIAQHVLSEAPKILSETRGAPLGENRVVTIAPQGMASSPYKLILWGDQEELILSCIHTKPPTKYQRFSRANTVLQAGFSLNEGASLAHITLRKNAASQRLVDNYRRLRSLTDPKNPQPFDHIFPIKSFTALEKDALFLIFAPEESAPLASYLSGIPAHSPQRYAIAKQIMEYLRILHSHGIAYRSLHMSHIYVKKTEKHLEIGFDELSFGHITIKRDNLWTPHDLYQPPERMKYILAERATPFGQFQVKGSLADETLPHLPFSLRVQPLVQPFEFIEGLETTSAEEQDLWMLGRLLMEIFLDKDPLPQGSEEELMQQLVPLSTNKQLRSFFKLTAADPLQGLMLKLLSIDSERRISVASACEEFSKICAEIFKEPDWDVIDADEAVEATTTQQQKREAPSSLPFHVSTFEFSTSDDPATTIEKLNK